MLTLYHGTKRDNGKRILATKTFHRSMGNNHWLGDGIYFYAEKSYAFRWLYLDYGKNHPSSIPKLSNIINKYIILSADISIELERIFDLTRAEHKMMFDKVFQRSIEKNKNLGLKIVDGAVLNLMFQRMDYNKRFDMIKALFIHEDNDISINKTRLAYIPEVQYCVVDRGIIGEIKDINITDEDMSLFSFAQQYDDNGNGRLIKYRPRNGKYYI